MASRTDDSEYSSIRLLLEPEAYTKTESSLPDRVTMRKSGYSASR
jgi:hypothetical protein